MIHFGPECPAPAFLPDPRSDAMTDKPDHDTNSLVHQPDTVDVEIDEIETSAVVEHSPGAHESDDPLADVIADLESRLNMIRETHVEQEMLEVDVLTREGELVVYRDDIAERERALGDTEIELREREMRVEAERGEFLRQRERLAERLRELEELEAALVEHVEDQAFEPDVDEERETIQRERERLKNEQQTLSARETEVKSKADEIAEERAKISSVQEELVRDKRVLEQQAEEQQKLASQLEQMRGELSEREKELESRLAEHDELKDMLENMSSQLDESRAEARAQAENYEQKLKERAAEAQRNEDLERRCRTLETERARIRGELTKVRQELSSSEPHPGVALAGRQQLVTKPRRTPSRSAEFAGFIWFVTMGIAAIGIAVSMSEGTIGSGLATLGAAAGLCVFASHALVGRTADSSMLVIAAFAGTFGLWFPHWLETVSTAVSLWDVPAEILPPALTDRMPMAFSAGTAALGITICLFLLTNSANVLAHALFATIVAVGVLMVPDQSVRLQALAAVVWLAIVSATMVKWAVQTNLKRSGALT